MKKHLPKILEDNFEKSPMRKDIVRIGFNPGILNIRDHGKLNSLSWPDKMLSWLQENYQDNLIHHKNAVVDAISQQMEAIISPTVSLDDINLFMAQLLAQYSDALEMAVRIYTWSDAGIHQILNTALNSNRRTFAGKTVQGWEVIIFNMIQYIKRGQSASSLPHKVYRGCNATSSEIDFYVSNGCSFAWKGFISTSSKFDVALQFALDAHSRRKVSPVVFEIELSQCSKNIAIDIAKLSYYPSESEILFLPGSAFQVSEVVDYEKYVKIQCFQIESPLHIKGKSSTTQLKKH